MMRASEKLSRTDIKTILRAGLRLSCGIADVRYMKSRRFAASVVVGKQAAKTSVMRHRIRRCIYAALRELQPMWGTIHIVVIAKRPDKSPTTPLYTESLKVCAQRIP